MAEGLRKNIKERIHEIENQIFDIDDKISRTLLHKCDTYCLESFKSILEEMIIMYDIMLQINTVQNI